jgi:hypothetical protein
MQTRQGYLDLGLYLLNKDRERAIECLQLAQEEWRDSPPAKKAQAQLRKFGIQPREPRRFNR